MMKRVILFAFVLSTLALVALAPLNVSPAADHSAKLQETLVVTVAVVTSTPAGGGAIPVTGMPTSTMIIVALLVILGIAVVIGGFALMSRRA